MKAYVKSSDGREITVLDTCLESEVVNTLKNVFRIVEFMPEVRDAISELRIAFNEGHTGWGVEAPVKVPPNCVPDSEAAKDRCCPRKAIPDWTTSTTDVHDRKCRVTAENGGYFDKSLADCCEPGFEV